MCCRNLVDRAVSNSNLIFGNRYEEQTKDRLSSSHAPADNTSNTSIRGPIPTPKTFRRLVKTDFAKRYRNTRTKFLPQPTSATTISRQLHSVVIRRGPWARKRESSQMTAMMMEMTEMLETATIVGGRIRRIDSDILGESGHR